MAAISYDAPAILEAFSRQRAITFPLLSDAGSATIKRLRHSQYGCRPGLGTQPRRSSGRIRYPKICVRRAPECQHGRHCSPTPFCWTDRAGSDRVSSKSFIANRIQAPISLLLNPANGPAPVAGTKISIKHLDLLTYPTDAGIAPGKPLLHLYLNSSPALAFTFTRRERQDTAWFR